MLADKNCNNKTIYELNAKSKGIRYRLEYAPVGNDIKDPTVIICGITPGNDTWNMFLESLRNGNTFEKATRESIYSNMRKNLFECLDEIGLFNYLAHNHSYWQKAQRAKTYKDYWDKIFSDSFASNNCGMQLTQACNCAILRNTDSSQPTKTALNEIVNGDSNCLFNRFQINNSLKLIIFLGTTLNLEKYWKYSGYYNRDVRVLSLPHPSRNNRVFNNGDIFKPFNKNDNTQLRNAKERLLEAKRIISQF